MQPIRVAVIGCGALAHHQHLPNTANNPNLRLAVACDIAPGVAEKTKEEFGAERADTDWRNVVNDGDVDLIVLATHRNVREEVIVPALEAGKPVYVEKPFAQTYEEMMRILQAESQTGVPVCVGHNRRYSPAFREMMRLLEIAKKAGSDRPVRIDRRGKRAWRFYEERQIQALIRVCDDCRSWKEWAYRPGENQLLNEMTHFVDLALLIMDGLVPVRVFCDGSARGNFNVVITFEDGSMANLQQTLGGNFDYPKELIEVSHRFVTINMQNHLQVDQRGLLEEPLTTCFPLQPGAPEVEETGLASYYAAVDKAWQLYHEGKLDSAMCVSVEKGWYAMLDAFAKWAVRGEGEGNPSDLASAVRATGLTFKAWESCRLGQPVRICPEDFDIDVYAEE